MSFQTAPLRRGSAPRRYLFAVLTVAVIVGVRWLLAPVLGEHSPFILFTLAVLLAAWSGGLGPGLMATGLSALAGSYFFLQPGGVLTLEEPTQFVQVLIFSTVGVTISVLNTRLRSAQAWASDRQEALRESEERYRLLAEDLERRVEQRTAQLEEANQAMEAFSYSISHDLRAPLRGMQGFAQALQEDYGDRLDETGQEYARRIVAAAGRMEDLINDLLSYSRLSRAQIEPRRVPLSGVMAEVREQMGEAFAHSGARLLIEEPLPSVRGHRPTLVQTVTNLLANAVKFVPEGRAPEVRVWAENGGSRVRLFVEDNGIGIAPEYRDRIFNVFERLHGMETYPGTGIGLAIVRKAMDRMEGRAGVESEPGRGSRFWIELPAAPEEP